MVNIGGSKLGRLTSNGFGKVRAVLRVKPRDSAGSDTSDSRDVMSRVACIQEREDVFSSSRGVKIWYCCFKEGSVEETKGAKAKLKQSGVWSESGSGLRGNLSST